MSYQCLFNQRNVCKSSERQQRGEEVKGQKERERENKNRRLHIGEREEKSKGGRGGRSGGQGMKGEKEREK